jgi:hypothetical protein
VHLFRDEGGYLSLLADFVEAGLSAGESVIVIPTAERRKVLNASLPARGLDLHSARRQGRYLDLSAENCLAMFMKGGWPDESRFANFATNMFRQVNAPGRKVRGFGEMVAVLWENGQYGATVELERLWNWFRRDNPFPLLCSYPRSGFTAETRDSLREICAAHTQVIADDWRAVAARCLQPL